MTEDGKKIICPVCLVEITNPIINPRGSSLGGWVVCQNCQVYFHKLNLGSEAFRQAVKERYIQDLEQKIRTGQQAKKILSTIRLKS
ncbi:MAG: hypothetical protein WC610_03495 [Patescibacteria group bacterium]